MFVAPMLCALLRDPARLDDPRYVAEPKLDGQRAQVHVAGGRTVACFSRLGRPLLSLPGLAWLRDMRWPVDAAAVDGELCGPRAGDGISGVLGARGRPDGGTCFLAFDLLRLHGRPTLDEPWVDRRKRLEDLASGLGSPRLALVPVADDAVRLWTLWVGQGGEGIVLKDRRARYRPGVRSPDWLKVKHRVTVRARVLEAEPAPVRWGETARAARVCLQYAHPRTGATVRVAELVCLPLPDARPPRTGDEVRVVCWGILPSGRLRHPVLLPPAPGGRG